MTNWISEEKLIIGMVHLEALPGTAGFSGNLDDVYQRALADAAALKEGGVTAVMIENAGDVPFPKVLDSVQTACLAAITYAIKRELGLKVGIDAAFCDYRAALSSAMAARADFVRLAVFVDTVVTASGMIEACSAEAIRYRKAIGAEAIKILADIQVKYSHPLLSGISIEESAKNAQMNLADAVIVTGVASGAETPIDVVQRVKTIIALPVIIGSGFSDTNAREQLAIADGAIVGSSLKKMVDGKPVIDSEKVKKIMKVIGGE